MAKPPKKVTSDKPVSGRERQKAVQRQRRQPKNDTDKMNSAGDRLIKTGLILLTLDQEMSKNDLATLWLLIDDKRDGTDKLLNEDEMRRAKRRAKSYLNHIHTLSETLSQPIIERHMRGNESYHKLTEYGKELFNNQRHRWRDCPTMETILVWQRQARDQRYGVTTQQEQRPIIPEPDLPQRGVLDEYAKEDEDLIEEAIDTIGEEEMSSRDPVDITEIADGFTKAKFKELIKNNPDVQASIAKAIGVKHTRSSRASEEEDDEDMSMSKTMSRSMKDMMQGFMQMQMWQAMMRMFGVGATGYAPNPFNPQQPIPVNPQTQSPYPQQNHPQQSPIEQFLTFSRVLQELNSRDTVTMKELQEIMSRQQQEATQRTELTQLKQLIEDQARKQEQLGQQTQFDQLRSMITQMTQEGVIQRNAPMTELMQALMQFQSQAQQQQQAHQIQMAQYQEQVRQKEAEYVNAQIERLTRQLEHQGRSGMAGKLEDAMEDIMISKLRSVQEEGKDSEIQKLSLLKDMVGTATESIAKPLGSAVSEGLKEGVRERVARSEQAGAPIFPSATPTPNPAYPVPQASPAPHPATPQPATTHIPANPQLANPLSQVSGLQLGLPEGRQPPKPKTVLTELP